ncbi:MAG: carbohydrate kinase family protein [Microcoleaceae cyanobacterium]
MSKIQPNSPRVLCLGEVLLDYLADQPGQQPEAVQSWTPYPGGAPANVACGLVKLGTSAGFIGAVGQDQAGEQLVQLLHQTGVDTAGIQWHSTAPTRAIYVTRSPTGEREFAGFGERQTHEFADTYLQARLIPEYLFAEAEFLVLGTLGLASIDSHEAAIHSLKWAGKHHLKIFMDVNWRPMFWSGTVDPKLLILEVLKCVDFVKLSHEESEWLFGTVNPIEVCYQLATVEGVIVTFGERGCAYCLSGQSGLIPGFSVNVEDTTGAGDGFVAGLIHQFCNQGIKGLQDPETTRQMMIYANAVGALTTTKPGAATAQPTATEVETFLNDQVPTT